MTMITGLAMAFLASIQMASPPPVRHSVPLQVNTYGLYTVETGVGRQVLFSGNPNADPVPFIVDTGASHTAVPRMIAMQLVDQDLITLDQTGHSLTGRFDTNLVFVDHLDFGLGARMVEVAVFEEAYGSVMSTAGLLGTNAFDHETLQIDFPARRLNVLSGPLTTGSADLTVLNGLIIGEARIRGIDEPVRVLVDTGATASLANSALVRARGGPTRSNARVVAGISGSEIEAETRKLLSRFQLDDLCVGLFEITVSDVYAFESLGWGDEPALILGMDILKDGVLTIDHHNGLIRLEGRGQAACSQARDFVSLNPW